MADTFTPKSRLGAGAFGEVWLAYDGALDIDRAVKLILPNRITSQENFFEEAQILKRLEHPNIVRVDDAGRMDDGRLYIAMQYEAAGSIADRAAGAPMPTRDALALVCGALRGLEHAHNCGVVHRDIKPGNILIGSSGEGKLSDFGLATYVGAGGAASPQGYIAHAAPEIIRDEYASVLTDIYAVGVTLYRLLNGDDYLTPPEDRETAICDGRFPDRNRYRLFIPRSLKTIVNRAMHVEPQSRYQSSRDLRQALERTRIACNWYEEPISDGILWRTKLKNKAVEVMLTRLSDGRYRICTTRQTAAGARRVTACCHDRLSQSQARTACHAVLTGFVTERR